MRLLHVGPLPPTASGIADYSAALIQELQKRVALSVAIADDAPQPTGLPAGIPIYRASELTRKSPHLFDAVLYQMGNHRYHAWMLALIEAWPGFLDLHDGTLHHMYADFLLSRGRIAAYTRELGALEGMSASRHAEESAKGNLAPRWFEDPMLGSVTRGSSGIITHSSSVRRAALLSNSRARVCIIHLGVDAIPETSVIASTRVRVRKEYGLTNSDILIGTFGGLTSEKRIDSIIGACAELRRQSLPVYLFLGGEEQNPGVISDHILANGMVDAVFRTGRLPLDRLEDAMAACDLCVQMRQPTSGEASAIVLRAIRLGRPTIVSNEGWFADLPNAAVRHIDANSDWRQCASALAQEIGRLIARPNELLELRKYAQHVASDWSWSRAADSYLQFINETLSAQKLSA